jgi:hypothetical protein
LSIRLVQGTAPVSTPDPMFIIGAPRSGTTWLAKIFDSHPDVFYLHEPDTVLRNPALPIICRRGEIAKYRPVADEYVKRLLQTQTLKTVGSLPVFGKTYRGIAAHGLRTGMIFAMHALGQITRRVHAVARVAVPTMADRGCGHPVRPVIKSVS